MKKWKATIICRGSEKVISVVESIMSTGGEDNGADTEGPFENIFQLCRRRGETDGHAQSRSAGEKGWNRCSCSQRAEGNES